MNSSGRDSVLSNALVATDGSLSLGGARADLSAQGRSDALNRTADLSWCLAPSGPLEPHWVHVIESATD
ncbi:MAG: hypothetical protein SF187_07135 [Deltaproteobacteria bacterium]|nr:hypothetical protein [Deltaproteobacteria bacterium]